MIIQHLFSQIPSDCIYLEFVQLGVHESTAIISFNNPPWTILSYDAHKLQIAVMTLPFRLLLVSVMIKFSLSRAGEAGTDVSRLGSDLQWSSFQKTVHGPAGRTSQPIYSLLDVAANSGVVPL